ncbi:hypothetical protein ACGFJC_47685 [Nonomuraea fuscirosea]|uniref:hypothetical protein n=1 Tax=Nonomuraea fuscirosea TaxID=1291556 RepID=UPI0037166A87
MMTTTNSIARPAGHRLSWALDRLPPQPDPLPHVDLADLPAPTTGQRARAATTAAATGLALAAIAAALSPAVIAFSPAAALAATIAWTITPAYAVWAGLATQLVCTVVWLVNLTRTERAATPAGNPGQVLALREEAWFRLGAEHWTRRQRATSTILFGLAHLTWYTPILAGLLPMLGATTYMSEYLAGTRAAGPAHGLLQATTAHATYNRVAVPITAAALVLAVIWTTTP